MARGGFEEMVLRTRGGMAFWAVSDLNDAELTEFVRAFTQG